MKISGSELIVNRATFVADAVNANYRIIPTFPSSVAHVCQCSTALQRHNTSYTTLYRVNSDAVHITHNLALFILNVTTIDTITEACFALLFYEILTSASRKIYVVMQDDLLDFYAIAEVVINNVKYVGCNIFWFGGTGDERKVKIIR